MALPVQQQPYSGERSSSSWYEKIFTNKRRHHSSAPPPPPPAQERRTPTTRTGPEPVHQPAARTSRHQQAASTAGSSTSSSTAADDDAGGPLSFPEPNFSPALKVVDYDGSVTLVSQATGRRWRVVDSSRGCQFGEVLRAVELSGEAGPAAPAPAYFAIKELQVDKLIEMQGRTHEDPLKEVAALQYLPSHPNVLACTEALLDENSIYIVTPFYSGGEVFNALSASGQFEESQARLLFRQVLDGLLHLKRHGVCHRDVSLENLLFAEEGVVKLVDFGLALRIPQSEDGSARTIPPQGPCGKPYYMAPEVVSSSSSSGFDGFAVDVWACGILVFAMLTGVAPFELALPSQDMRFHTVAVRERLTELLSAWNMPLSPEATDLIQSCLLLAPERRPSLEELVNHNWVKA